jgi:hypothetical protein
VAIIKMALLCINAKNVVASGALKGIRFHQMKDVVLRQTNALIVENINQ